jgi:hypothetical protein
LKTPAHDLSVATTKGTEKLIKNKNKDEVCTPKK